MLESLYQTADARVSISDSRCGSLYIRQRMLETFYQTAHARDSILDADARDSISDSG